MYRVDLWVQADLSVDTGTVYADTPDERTSEIGASYLTRTEPIGELNITPPITDDELFTDSELHELFAKSDHEYNFTRFVFENHPHAQEIIAELPYDASELNITVTKVQAEIRGDDAAVIQAAASSTENVEQTLLEYATLNDSCFRNLSFNAEKLLEDKLAN